MLKNDLITLVLIIVFLYPLLKGFLIKFSSSHTKKSIDNVTHNIIFLVSIFLSMHVVRKIFLEHEKGIFLSIYTHLPYKVIQFCNENPMLIYTISIPIFMIIIYEIIKLLIKLINNLTIYPALDNIDEKLKQKNNFSRRSIGAIFELPRATAYVIIITFLFNISSMFNIVPNLDRSLEKSFLYNNICKHIVIPITNSTIAKNLPNIIDNSFKIVTKEIDSIDFENSSNIITYYNGITIDEGIKSSDKLDFFAISLTASVDSDIKKSRLIYDWIENEISYDSEKADMIMNNIFDEQSGAVNTFETREGICFDYACLFAAMCRANDIKVRVITGEGFNGEVWVSHAWNQVYIREEERWINVDTTFSIGGDYFDCPRFKIDHKQDIVAGEW
jgi:uncharacterized membrane protein YbjE (DUF340 family)